MKFRLILIIFLYFKNSQKIRRNEKFSPALIAPSSALITPLPANVLNNTGGNPRFCSFVSFLIVSLIPFISNPHSLSDLTFFHYIFYVFM